MILLDDLHLDVPIGWDEKSLLWHPRSNTADFEPSDDSDGTLTSEEEIDLPYQAARLYELPENTHTNLRTKAHHLSHPLFLAHGTEANPLKWRRMK